ncbi:hypothetical protein GCM10010275_20840 [Streptomyces litmocidini]|nr:hypothetical protein GCM10010275_20840 [Streptomyces litmocidini]
MPAACPISLTSSQRRRPKKAASGHKTEHRPRVRAQVVLHAARGRSNARIAAGTGLHLDTVRRRLTRDALKSWQHRSWIFITDPDFRPKTERVLDLYARIFDGEPPGTDEYATSADEKTPVQARCRCHPTLAPGQARARRVSAARSSPSTGPRTGSTPRSRCPPPPSPSSRAP